MSGTAWFLAVTWWCIFFFLAGGGVWYGIWTQGFELARQGTLLLEPLLPAPDTCFKLLLVTQCRPVTWQIVFLNHTFNSKKWLKIQIPRLHPQQCKERMYESILCPASGWLFLGNFGIPLETPDSASWLASVLYASDLTFSKALPFVWRGHD
jgi:hypothetical protein